MSIITIQPDLFPGIERRPRISVDVCASRHLQNPASVAANPTAERKSEMCRQILAFVDFKGGSYSKEIHEQTGIGYTTVSARLSDLKAAGQIYGTGERVRGCEIVKVRK